ncbi:MAG: 4-(cytidine 5'-diphospho)-2-C-methyl-D-erythritol kinase [Nitrospira sp.]|nr:4-(cytidine 5'-diphospho)-2-C-methyl-D-erythritol kinase [Nitrospira sp.]
MITIVAPAKVNLILRVLDRRPDGYHNLWSIMQTVGLEDEVSIRVAPHRSDIRLGCDDASLRTDQSNLVYRAAAAVLERSGKSVGLDIYLTKRIPMGAGLGGGSSDAAATIIGLNRILHLEWLPAQMAEVGQTLGSDVPFFLYAPAAIVAGRGEDVRPIQLAGGRWIVLVNPGFPVETKWAYQQLSATRKGLEPLSEGLRRLESHAPLSWNDVLDLAGNDFELPVFSAHPVLREIKEELLAAGAEIALLSGSGATVFGVFRDEAGAQQAVACFQPRRELKVFAVPACSGPLGAR